MKLIGRDEKMGKDSNRETTETTTTKFIENWKNNYLLTLFSHPQIAYKLIEAGGAEDILQVQDLYIDGLNNREDTTIQ